MYRWCTWLQSGTEKRVTVIICGKKDTEKVLKVKNDLHQKNMSELVLPVDSKRFLSQSLCYRILCSKYKKGTVSAEHSLDRLIKMQLQEVLTRQITNHKCFSNYSFSLGIFIKIRWWRQGAEVLLKWIFILSTWHIYIMIARVYITNNYGPNVRGYTITN